MTPWLYIISQFIAEKVKKKNYVLFHLKIMSFSILHFFLNITAETS